MFDVETHCISDEIWCVFILHMASTARGDSITSVCMVTRRLHFDHVLANRGASAADDSATQPLQKLLIQRKAV